MASLTPRCFLSSDRVEYSSCPKSSLETRRYASCSHTTRSSVSVENWKKLRASCRWPRCCAAWSSSLFHSPFTSMMRSWIPTVPKLFSLRICFPRLIVFWRRTEPSVNAKTPSSIYKNAKFKMETNLQQRAVSQQLSSQSLVFLE